MRRIALIIFSCFLFSSVFAYENDSKIDSTFQMLINSIKDDEFEVDEDGVWLVNSEITATIHLNPDSILFVILIEPDSFNQVTYFTGKGIIENYGDSVKLVLPVRKVFNCDEVLRIVIKYGSNDNISEQKNLATDRIKIIDYVTNKECLAAYRKWTSISLPDASDDSKSKGKQGIFDLSGRRLSSPPSKGIYIHNGKKVIATGSH
ncbi:MAG: hypothetical protein K6F47_07610 [Bacteroidaceae bacterium]|nr:hypothetical protein [Bacteroidaceae bacterium]